MKKPIAVAAPWPQRRSPAARGAGWPPCRPAAGQGRHLRDRPDPHLRHLRDRPLRHHHQPRPLQHQGRHGRSSTATGKSGKVDITMDIELDQHRRRPAQPARAEQGLLQRRPSFRPARFVADKFDFNGDKVSEVDGTLTLLGQTRPVKLKASRFNCYMSPLIKRQVCGGDFETTIERSQWGVTWGIPFGFEDKVRLLVQVEAIRHPVETALGVTPRSLKSGGASRSQRSDSQGRSRQRPLLAHLQQALRRQRRQQLQHQRDPRSPDRARWSAPARSPALVAHPFHALGRRARSAPGRRPAA